MIVESYKAMVLLDTERAKYRRYCKNCGHSVIIPKTSKANKVICTWCGYYIFKNDFEEFKEKIKKVLK